MIILREAYFSSNKFMIKEITRKLDSEGIEDYDINDKISKNSISITTDLNDLKIYIPLDLEYSQYDIDDFIRSISSSYIKTDTELDRDIYVMTLSKKLTEIQYYKLIKHIIEENEFCTLLEEN